MASGVGTSRRSGVRRGQRCPTAVDAALGRFTFLVAASVSRVPMRTAFTAIFLAVLSVLGAVVSPWAAAAAECPSRAAALVAMGLRVTVDCGTAPGGACGDSCGGSPRAVASCCCAPIPVVVEPAPTCCGSDTIGAGHSTAGVACLSSSPGGSDTARAAGCAEGTNAAPVRGCQGCRASAVSALTALEGTTRSRLSTDAGETPARVVTAANQPPARQWRAGTGRTELVLDSSRRRALLCVRTI